MRFKSLTLSFLVLAVTCFLAVPAFAQYQNFQQVSITGFLTSTNAGTATALQNQLGMQVGRHTLSWIASGTVSTCTISIEGATNVGATPATVPGSSAQTCTTSGSITWLSQPQNFVRVNPSVMTGSGTVQYIYTGYVGTASVQGYGGIGEIFNVASAAGTASLSATTMATTPVTGNFRLSWYITQSIVGASCAGNTTVTVNVIYTDTNAASEQTVVLALHTVTTNGTIGNVPWTSGPISYTFTAKAATNIKYSTTVSAGGSCAPVPTYVITPILEAL